MKIFLSMILVLYGVTAYSQVKLTITGEVVDAATGNPLAYATIGVKTASSKRSATPVDNLNSSWPRAQTAIRS